MKAKERTQCGTTDEERISLRRYKSGLPSGATEAGDAISPYG
jgi:hypothetical protein